MKQKKCNRVDGECWERKSGGCRVCVGCDYAIPCGKYACIVNCTDSLKCSNCSYNLSFSTTVDLSTAKKKIHIKGAVSKLFRKGK